MGAALLDANMLLALAWPTHVHHQAAQGWFRRNREKGWATCPHTQLAFLRLSTQPIVVRATVTMADAQLILAENLAEKDHEFWRHDYPITEIMLEIREHIVGHKQLADAFLLDLAIRRKGRLATLDRRIAGLLAPDSAYRAHLEIIGAS